MTGTDLVSWNAPAKVGGACLLLLSGLKGLSAAVAWEALGRRADPVLGLPENWVMLVTGLFEGCGAWILLWSGSTVWNKAWVMILLGLSWLGYQWLHASGAMGGTCPCLGQAPIWFPWLARFEKEMLASVALWFFLVGLTLIAFRSLCKATRETS